MQHHHRHVRKDIPLCLQDLLRQCRNSYYGVYYTTREYIHNQQPISLHLRIIHDNWVDQRRYNHPRAAEATLILPRSGEEEYDDRDFVIHERGHSLKSISKLGIDYLPLRYPLLIPKVNRDGIKTYEPTSLMNGTFPIINISLTSPCRPSGKGSQAVYYAHCLHTRRGRFKILHNSGRLCTCWEFIVEMYAQIE
jgi:hypothetical protein